MGKVFCLIGKSSSGKDSLYKEIKKKNPKLKSYVMYTTRPARCEETEGRDYRFISNNRFEQLLKEKKVIEYRTYDTVHGPWTYATINDGQIDLKTGDYIVIGTIESFLQLKNYFGKEKVVPIYVEVEDGERLQRALDREKKEDRPSYLEVCRRFLADDEDFSKENLLKLGIVKYYNNDDLYRCADEIAEDISGYISN